MLGFRHFYSLAAIFALIAIPLWLLSLSGVSYTGGYLSGLFWHSHEMVFGFALAVMSGFLLTAVRNWTGLPTPTGLPLAALATLWIAGRVLIITGPPILAVVVDFAFLPLLILAIARPIIENRNRRNYKIVALLVLIALTHGVYHAAAMGPLPAWLAYTSVITAMDLITIVLAIVAGRVIPAFTKNAVPESNPRHAGWLEVLCFGSLVLIAGTKIASDWVAIPVMVPTVLLVVAAVSHAVRLGLWQPHLTTHNVLLWMMPVAYSWLPVAFVLRALAQYSVVGEAAWIHALTTGAISGFMLAMMMRSSLGHTGRPLVASGVDMNAFVLLQLAAIIRVAAGFLPAAAYESIVILSGAIWTLAFFVFLLRYLPMLIRPRIDGRPG